MIKRIAINLLLGIASVFTKEKILQRVLIATLDDVKKNVDDVSTVRMIDCQNSYEYYCRIWKCMCVCV